ncbi:MAG: hypothetical protein KAT47_00115 [Candidatus Aegiribacteria sp.]|nr:hypothetical protein [Candidatus Aegiribacteria sp.]
MNQIHGAVSKLYSRSSAIKNQGGSEYPPFLLFAEHERIVDLKHLYLTGAALISVCLITNISCGTVSEADTWLISIDNSTISVSEAAYAWIMLSPEQQNYFIQRGDHVNRFIVSLARKKMVIREIHRLNYLQRPDVIALGNAWIRRQASLLARETIIAAAEESITEDDINYFKDHMGTTVWYTVLPESPGEMLSGPAHLPELSRELAVHLDSMNPGDELPLSDGTLIRYDSVVVTDPVLVSETLENSERVTDFALQRLSAARGKADLERIADSILSAAEPGISDTAISDLTLYYSGLEDLIPEDSIVISRYGIMTSSDFEQEIEYQSGFMPVQPYDAVWLEWFIDITLLNDALMHYFVAVNPEQYANLSVERDAWMLSIASDKLFSDEVYSVIGITPELIRDEFDNLIEIPIIPEKRSIQCVQIQSDDVYAYETALSEANGVDSIIEGCGFWKLLSEDNPPSNITRLLLMEEIPGFRGEEVFAMLPGDTVTWSSLSSLFEDYEYMAFRLVEIYPPHTATFEELEEDLYQTVRVRLEEERTSVWLEELGEKYSLVINEDLLPSLPSDPALWITY